MTDPKKMQDDAMSDEEMDGVAAGTQGAGSLYPGQTDETLTPASSTFNPASGLGSLGSDFSLNDPNTGF